MRNLSLDSLLPRMHGRRPPEVDHVLEALMRAATMPELQSWLARNQDRAARITAEEASELLSMQGMDGPLARVGVEQCVEAIERRRRLLHQVRTVAGTEYLSLLEQMVGLLYEKVRPGR